MLNEHHSDSQQDTTAIFEFSDNKKSNWIYLDNLVSPSQGKGYGTKAIRYLFQLSMSKGYGGEICLDACHSSHLFHLYMGMIPNQKPVGYIATHYGLDGLNAILDLQKCAHVNDLENITDIHPTLTHILYTEKNTFKQNVTISQLFAEKQFLIELLNKKTCYLTHVFIPKLLLALSENTERKYPDTSSLWSVRMTMSEQGKSRWTAVIQNETQFEPFRNLEHLRTFMTTDQNKKLDAVLVKINGKQQNNVDSLKFFTVPQKGLTKNLKTRDVSTSSALINQN